MILKIKKNDDSSSPLSKFRIQSEDIPRKDRSGRKAVLVPLNKDMKKKYSPQNLPFDKKMSQDPHKQETLFQHKYHHQSAESINIIIEKTTIEDLEINS